VFRGQTAPENPEKTPGHQTHFRDATKKKRTNSVPEPAGTMIGTIKVLLRKSEGQGGNKGVRMRTGSKYAEGRTK
jgi:hypothetical protein